MAAALLTAACSRGGSVSIPADTLATCGNACLTRTELLRSMPAGLSSDDSTVFARAYIRNWLEGQLIASVAVDEIDMDEIDRLTEEYRQSLITAQYRRTMARQASDGIFSPDTVRAYYDAHQADFAIERPLVKGVYLKVPQDARELPTLRRLYKSERSVDIDKLDKAAIGSAIHYDYFRDRWVDQEQIENRVPADISASLAAHKPVDITSGGFVYLLSINDYLPAGSTMPYEAAVPLIRERLLTQRRIAYDEQLRNELLARAIADGTVTFPGQNPLR